MEAPPSDNLYIQDMPAELDEASVKSTFEQYGAVQSVRLFKKEGMPKMSCFVRFATVEEAQWVQENVNGNIPEGMAEPIKVRFADTPESKAARMAAKGDSWGKGAWGAGGDSWGKGSWSKGGDSWGVAAWTGARSTPYGDGKGKGKGKPGGIRQVLTSLLESQTLPGGVTYTNDENALYVAGLPHDTTDLDLYHLFGAFGAIQPRGVRAMMHEDGSCKGYGFVNFLDNVASQSAIMVLHGTELPGGKFLTVQTKQEGSSKGAKGEDGGKGADGAKGANGAKGAAKGCLTPKGAAKGCAPKGAAKGAKGAGKAAEGEAQWW